jgi:hypothetical protein
MSGRSGSLLKTKCRCRPSEEATRGSHCSPATAGHDKSGYSDAPEPSLCKGHAAPTDQTMRGSDDQVIPHPPNSTL